MPSPTSISPEDAIVVPGPKLTFLPAVVGEYVLDVDEQLAKLRDLLAQERWAFQRTNITKAIEMYESGAWPLPGCRQVWLKNGEVLDGFPDKINAGEYLWCEGIGYQVGQSAATPLAATPLTTTPVVGSRDSIADFDEMHDITWLALRDTIVAEVQIVRRMACHLLHGSQNDAYSE